MKRSISLLIAAVFFAQNLPVLYAVENATVKSVRVSAESVYITTDKAVQYKAFSTGRPPKLVLELMDTRLKTLEDIPVNGPLLRRVRTGQFQTSPSSVSRVVLELSQKAAYEITRKGAELAVILGDKQPRVRDTPAAPASAGMKLITPSDASASEKPLEIKMESASVTSEDISKESVPVIMPKKSHSARPSYRGIMDNLSRDPVSFDYNDAGVREVISMMAAKAGVNVIYSEDVSGTITINLDKVPFDEAFKTILEVKGLSAQQVGDNILRIASPQTFLAEQKKARLQTRVFFLNYSKASDVKAQVDAVTTAEARKANCVVDETNNALIVTDTPMGLEGTARLLKSLDRVPKQVMIEVKLVEVKLDNSFDLGVDWSFSSNSNGISGKYSFPGPVPGAVPAGSFTFGKVLGNTRFDAVIAAAVHKGKAKILSDPKVATLNNKEASINITDQTPYDQQTVTIVNNAPVTAHSWQNVPTGITLKVTPTINSDGRITMHIVPSVVQLSGVPNGIAPPPTATRGTDTNVIVKNSETIVIGGLIQDTQSDEVYKVPLLGDIPLIGVLFRKKSVSRSRKELLIFVTPTVIEE